MPLSTPRPSNSGRAMMLAKLMGVLVIAALAMVKSPASMSVAMTSVVSRILRRIANKTSAMATRAITIASLKAAVTSRMDSQ